MMYFSWFGRFSKSLLLPLLTTFLLALYTPLNGQIDVAKNSARYLEAVKNFSIGNLELAERQLLEILSKERENDAAHYYLSRIYLSRGQYTKAEHSLNNAIKADGNNSWYKLQLATVYNYTGNTQKAIKLFNELRKREPLKNEFYDALIDIYIRERDFEKAQQVLEDIEKSAGVSEATGLTRYNLLIFMGKQQEAIDYLRDFDINFGTPRTSTIVGDSYAAEQKDTLALEYYQKALSMAPDYIPASFGMAEIFRVQNKFDLYFDSMFPFMANRDIDPAMKTGYMDQLMGNVRFVQTFLPQIDTMMTNMYQAHSSDSSVAFKYALFLVQSGKSGRALEVLHSNLELYPNSKEAHRQYLSLIYYLEMWEPMELKSSEALKVFPNDTGFLQFKAISLLQQGKRANSIKLFQEILTFAKRDSATFVNTLTTLGDLNYQEGNTKEAFKYYRKTIKKEPKHLPALNNYAYFLSLERKSLSKALKMSKITIESEPNNATYLDTYGWILHLLGRNGEAKAIFKHAMIYGGKENADILDHYAEVLFALKEYELAFIYWGQADKLDPSLGISQKIVKKREEVESKRQ